jgi:hypothetical protein
VYTVGLKMSSLEWDSVGVEGLFDFVHFRDN